MLQCCWINQFAGLFGVFWAFWTYSLPIHQLVSCLFKNKHAQKGCKSQGESHNSIFPSIKKTNLIRCLLLAASLPILKHLPPLHEKSGVPETWGFYYKPWSFSRNLLQHEDCELLNYRFTLRFQCALSYDQTHQPVTGFSRRFPVKKQPWWRHQANKLHPNPRGASQPNFTTPWTTTTGKMR